MYLQNLQSAQEFELSLTPTISLLVQRNPQRMEDQVV